VDRFSVDRFLFSPGRRLIGFVVRGVSRRGTLASVTGLISDMGLDITYCSTKATVEGEEGRVLLVVDFTDATRDPGSVAGRLESLGAINRVEVIRPRVEGFIADTAFPLIVGSARAVLLDESALRGLLISFREHLGSGGEAMLYHIGLDVGRERWTYILQMAEEINAESFSDKVLIAADVFRSMGYGVMKVEELKEETPYARFEIWDCIECQLGRPSKRPFSQFIRGLLAGLTSIIYGREMYAKENRCLAMGAPYCEFEIKPQG